MARRNAGAVPRDPEQVQRADGGTGMRAKRTTAAVCDGGIGVFGSRLIHPDCCPFAPPE